MNTVGPFRIGYTFILLAILLVATLTRLFGITMESPWNDEALTLRHVAAPSFAEYLKGVFDEDPWLVLSQGYYWVQYGWVSLFGPSVLSVRLLSVTLSVACIPLIAAMGSLVHSPRAGLLAGLLFALSLVQTYFGQETRFYALLNLEAMVAMLGLLLALHGRARLGWALHAAGNVALLVTHAFTPLLFAAQGLFLCWHWRRAPLRLLGWTAAQGALLGAFFLWTKYGIAYDFADKTQAYNDVPPTWREFVMTYIVFAGGRFSNEDPGKYMLSLDWPVTIMVVGLTLLGLLHLFRQRRDTAVFLLCWMLIPVALLFVASLLWRPVFQYRYVLPSAVPFMLLAAIGWRAIPSARARAVALCSLVVCLAWQQAMLPRPMRPDFNAFARQVMDSPAPVLAMKPFVARAARLALPEGSEVVTLYGMNDLLHEMDFRLDRKENVYLIFHHWIDFSKLKQHLLDSGAMFNYQQIGGIPPLTVYEVSSV